MPWFAEFLYRARPMGWTIIDVEPGAALEEQIHHAFGHRLARIVEAKQNNDAKNSL